MPYFRLDDKHVPFEPGETLLQASLKAGIHIPTLCYLEGLPPQTSCFLCVVRVNGMQRLLPSCATKAEEGMEVQNNTPDVLESRRTAIELLLSDHLGDCIAPCQEICPAHMNMPLMNRQIARGDFREALITVKEDIALPAILGRICPELCEKGCRRGPHDGALSICLMKRFVADYDLESGDPWLPAPSPHTGKRVAIIGAGPAGLSAAWHLTLEGHECTLFDERMLPGGALRTAIPEERLPRHVLDAEIDMILRLGVRFEGDIKVGEDMDIRSLLDGMDAVLVATGPRTNSEIPSPIPLEELRMDRKSLRTNVPKLFVAGSAVTPSQHAIRAVAEGKNAAHSIHQFLTGAQHADLGHDFSVHIGKLSPLDIPVYLVNGSPNPRTPVHERGLTIEEAQAEARRCLHCDCEGAEDCRLRMFAKELGANPLRFRGEKRGYERDTTHPNLIFESGKCIACGICVRIAAQEKERLGLTFVGRGFALKTRAPFGEDLAVALKESAEACAKACPTGALIWRPSKGNNG